MLFVVQLGRDLIGLSVSLLQLHGQAKDSLGCPFPFVLAITIVLLNLSSPLYAFGEEGWEAADVSPEPASFLLR